MKMKTSKKIYNQNKPIILSSALLLFSSAVFGRALASETAFLSNSISGILFLMLGIMLGACCDSRANKKYIPIFCIGSVILNLCCFYTGFTYTSDFSIYISPLCSLFSIYFLSRYYIYYSTASTAHSLIYILSSVAFIYSNAGKIDPFFASTLQIFLFLCLHNNIKDIRIKVINIIYTVIAALFNFFLIVSNAYNYMTLRFEEGHRAARIRLVVKSLKPFGKSENYGEIENLKSDFQLIKIFGRFGYVAGILVLSALTVFIACILIKAFRNKNKVNAGALTAAVIFSVNYVSSLFINSGIVFGNISVSVPIISQEIYSLFIAGILLGLILDNKRTII